MSLVVLGNTTLTSQEVLASRIYTITIDSALGAICIVLFFVFIAFHIGLFVLTTRKNKKDFRKSVSFIHESATKLIHLSQAQQIHNPAPDTFVKQNQSGNVVASIAPYSNTPFVTKDGKVLNDTSKHYSSQKHYLYIQTLVRREQAKLYWNDMQRTTRRLFYAFPYWRYVGICCTDVTQKKPHINTIFQSISNVILFIIRIAIFCFAIGTEGYEIYLQTSGVWNNSLELNTFFKFLTNVSFIVTYAYYFVIIWCTIGYALFRLVLEIILRLKISSSVKDLKTRLPTGQSLKHNTDGTFFNQDVLSFLYQTGNKMSEYKLARYMDYIGQTNAFCKHFSKIQIADRICDIVAHVPLIWSAIALTCQFVVGFAFWCILVPSGTFNTSIGLNYITFAKHGVAVILMAVEFLISNYHFPIWYVFATGLYGVLYLTYLTILNFLALNNIIQPYEWPYGDFFNYDRNKLAVVYHIVLIGCCMGFFIVLYYGTSWLRRGIMELGMSLRSRVQKKKERKYWMEVEMKAMELFEMKEGQETNTNTTAVPITKTYHEEVIYTPAPSNPISVGGIPMSGGHMYYMPQTAASVIGTYTSPRQEVVSHQRHHSEVSEVQTYTAESD